MEEEKAVSPENQIEEPADASAVPEDVEPAAAAQPEDAPEAGSAETSAETAATAEAEEAESPYQKAWFVIHTYSGYENKVKKNLEQRIESMGMREQILQVVVPTEEEIEIRDGQRRMVERRIFPGYVLVQILVPKDTLTPSEQAWYVVRNTPGVTGFVSSGTKPIPLRQEEIDKIIKRMEAEEPTIKVSFHRGEKVQIISGPFAEFMGTVDSISMEKGKVTVLVSFFGRETPVEVDLTQVSRL
ncbi:MAG: transcription termination/antitermination protein NusG [Anaerolineales bacterium]